MSTQKLSGKVAVITGGSTGIGLATAQLFVQHGAHVFITGRQQADLDAAVQLIGSEHVTAVQGDVSNLKDLDRLYETVKNKKGHIDILFANAGIVGQTESLGSITEANYDTLFDINVKGLIFTVQKALPWLTDGAAIVLNASVVSIKGYPGGSVYCASKAAVRALARSWVLDLKGRNIRVNVVSPGPTETPIFERGGMDPVQVKGMREFIATQVPLGRIGRSDELAKTVLFLASSDSSFMNGAELFVDGGYGQV